MYVKKFRNEIDSFLFSNVNAVYASVFRIALAIMIIIVFILPESGIGYMFVEARDFGSLYENLFLTKYYSYLLLVISILFGIGFKPRPFGLALVILLFPLIFVYGYHVSRPILLFALLAFSLVQSDKALSITRRTPYSETDAGPIWPIRLIQIQLSVLYGINAIAKTTPEYLNGTILEGLSIMQPNFLVNLTDGYLHIGQFAIPVFMLAIASALTEYALAVGFWIRRLLIPTACLGVVFHISLTFIVDIGFLDWVTLFLYLAFLFPFKRN